MENLDMLYKNPIVKIYPNIFNKEMDLNYQINTQDIIDYVEVLDINKVKRISKQIYWERYYEDTLYEWNDGILEEKPVSDYQGILASDWFKRVLGDYAKEHPVCKIISLEMGFTLNLPHKTTIRKPDVGIILNSNPVGLDMLDISYSGTVDFCIEILSDSNLANIERDTITKKEEYCLAGVKEYLIIDAKGRETAFYRLSNLGSYIHIKPVNGIIKSEVLPGFQFRIVDLYNRPSQEEMSEDNVYKDFVFLSYQAEKKKVELANKKAEIEKKKAEAEKKKTEIAKKKAEAEKKKAEVEKKKTEIAKKKAKDEKERAKNAEEQIKYLSAKLKSLETT